MSLAPPKPSPLAPGFRLDRYELLCPIAQGGMASVWIARMRGKRGFEKLVAVKTILAEFATDARFERMFLDEARIASQIEHTNVAQILDLGDEHGVLYLVMEWVDGEALSKLQRAVEKKGDRVPIGVVLRVVSDAAAGLHAAHELRDRDGTPLGVVHRDVSPQNLLVSALGVAKVIDFGIAKARDRLAGETSTGFLKGKVQYMAPEQAVGRPLDRRADVWALGAVAYHLLAGKPPFEAENQLATLHLLTSGRPPLPLPQTIPACVAAVVKKALSHDPEARYATAAELQRALDAAAAEARVTATSADVAEIAAKYMGERAEARKKAIELALEAAAARAKVEKLLVPPDADSSSSGVGDVSSRIAAVAESAGFEERPSAKVTIAELPHLIRERLASTPLSEASSATLGSAAIDALPIPPPRGRRVALLGALGVLAIVATAIVAWRAGASSVAAPPSVASTPPAAVSERVPVSAPVSVSVPVPVPVSASVPASASASAPASTLAPPRPRPRPRPAPPRTSTAPRPTTIDDGF